MTTTHWEQSNVGDTQKLQQQRKNNTYTTYQPKLLEVHIYLQYNSVFTEISWLVMMT